MPRYDHAEDMFYIEYAGNDLSLDEAEAMLKEFALIIHRLKTENEMLKGGVNHQMKMAQDYEKDVATLRRVMRNVGRSLAGIGSRTHKDKNEVLMAQINLLLGYGSEDDEPRYMDDLPF